MIDSRAVYVVPGQALIRIARIIAAAPLGCGMSAAENEAFVGQLGKFTPLHTATAPPPVAETSDAPALPLVPEEPVAPAADAEIAEDDE